MRIAIVGAGGVGGGFGAALAKAGADVTFIARGAHLAAMKSAGLKVVGGRGETHVVPTQATEDPTSIGAVDVVLFCVKLWDVESAGEAIKPLAHAVAQRDFADTGAMQGEGFRGEHGVIVMQLGVAQEPVHVPPRPNHENRYCRPAPPRSSFSCCQKLPKRELGQ